MHQPRRKKKRQIMSNLKTVEVARGRTGYGFTLSGQSPCVLSCIISGSPAEFAGLKSGDFVMAVNGENVAKLSHEQVVKFIGTSTGVMRLTIAEKPRLDSDSSDDQYVASRPRPRSHPRIKSRTPPTPTNDHNNASRVDKVVEDLFRGTLFGSCPISSEAVDEEEEDDDEDIGELNSKFAPGHLSPFNTSGRKLEIFLKKPTKMYERTVWNGNDFDEQPSGKLKKNKQKKSDRHITKQQQYHVQHHQQQQQQQHFEMGRYISTPDPAGMNRPLSPLEVSSILYPSLQPHVSAAVPLDNDQVLDEDDLYMRAVVGYLGSIEIPSEANLKDASLQAIRGCVRRLRIEQRIHTLVLMEITITDVRLVTANGVTVVVYPADKLAFSGVCPDDKRFFGLVTMHGLEGDHDMMSSNVESGSSCHVFMVDPEICAHHIHAKKAAKFGVPCTVDPETNGCAEFPRSAKPILQTLAKLYQDRHNGLYVNELQRAQVYMGGEFPLVARRSNSNSSNSDSGIGYCTEGMNGSGNGERVMVVDIGKNGQMYRQDVSAPNKLIVRADVMHQHSDIPFSMSSTSSKSPMSSESSPKNDDVASRLTPRVCADPKNIPRPTSSLGFHAYAGSYDSQSSTQSSNNNMQHRAEIPQTAHGTASNSKPGKQKQMPAGLPPTGIHRHSMYARLDNVAVRKQSTQIQEIPENDFQQPWDERIISDGKMLMNRQEGKRRSGRGSFRRGKNKKNGMTNSHSKESIAASDGELPVPLPVPLSRSSSLRSVGSMCVQNDDIGHVASWAVGFERLLYDPLGLACFTEFLKKEFSEENIAFWIACEKYKKLTDAQEMKACARDIYNKHLSKKANMPVNLDSQARQEVEAQLENPTPTLYNMQQKQIFQLMKFDSYSRFLKSDLYRECMKAELEGKSLPIPPPKEWADSATDDSSVRDGKEDVKSNKKGEKKKKEKSKKSKESKSGDSSLDTTDENIGEKRRKSFMPWHRNKTGKKATKSSSFEKKEKKEDKSNVVKTEGSLTASTGSRRSSLASCDLQRFSSDVSESLERTSSTGSSEIKEPHKFCRVILPDNSTTVIAAKEGQSVRAALKLLCERRRIAVASMEVYDVKTNHMYNLHDDLSTLASKEVVVENRVMFKVELPSTNKRTIGVKSKPNKAIIDVLRPIMNKYNLSLDGMVVHLNASPVPLELDIEVATLEGQRVIIEPYAQYAAGRISMGRPPVPKNGRIRKADSVDNSLDESNVHVVHMRPAKSEEGLASRNIELGNPAFAGSTSTLSKYIRTGKDECAPQQKKGAERSDLFDLVARAQRNRMDDQRGMTPNLELPEFLRVQANARNAPGSRLKRSPPVCKGNAANQWQPKSASDSENVDEVNPKMSTASRCEVYYPPRPHSTPPIRQIQSNDLSFRDGILPTHHEAEFAFGGWSGISTPKFDDSEILGLSYREDNPQMELSYRAKEKYANFGNVTLTKSKSLSQNREDLSRLSPSVFNRDQINRNSPVVRFDIKDEAENMLNTTVIESTRSGQPDRTEHNLDIDDLDTTITASMPPPSPPSPSEVNRTYEWEEANYSPPPPLTSQEREALMNASSRTKASGPPKCAPPLPPKPNLASRTDKTQLQQRQQHARQFPHHHMHHPQQRPNALPVNSPPESDKSNESECSSVSPTSIPSPSTHDLFVSSPSPTDKPGTNKTIPSNSTMFKQPTELHKEDEDKLSLGRSILGDQYGSILKNCKSRSRSGISMPSDNDSIVQLGKEGEKLRITFV